MAFRQIATRTLLLLVGVVLSGCIGPFSPAATCNSDDTLDRVADIVFGSRSEFVAWAPGVAERRVPVGDVFRADMRERFRARLSQITLEQNDAETGRVTCSAFYETDYGEPLGIAYDSAPDVSGDGRVVRIIDVTSMTMNVLRNTLERDLQEAYALGGPAQTGLQSDAEPTAAAASATTDEFFDIPNNARVPERCFVDIDNSSAIDGDCFVDTTGSAVTAMVGAGGNCEVSLRRVGSRTTAVLDSYDGLCPLESRYRASSPLAFGEVTRDDECYRNDRVRICVGSRPSDFPSAVPPRAADAQNRFDLHAIAGGQTPRAQPAPSPSDVTSAIVREVEMQWEPDCETAQPGVFRIQIGVSADGRIIDAPTLQTSVPTDQLRNANLAIRALNAAAPFDFPLGTQSQTLTLVFDSSTACGGFQ